MHSVETVLNANNFPLLDLRSRRQVTHLEEEVISHVAKSTCFVRQEIQQISPSM